MKILHVINSLATGGAEKLILETIPKYNEKGIQADVILLNGTKHPFLQALQKENCCTIITFGKGSVYHPKYILQLISYFKKYDVIHAHLFPANYFVAAAKKLSFSSTPVIFTEHSTSNRRFRNRKLRALNSFIYRIFNMVVCITDEVKHQVLQMTNIPPERLTVINNGVDIDKIFEADNIPRAQINGKLLKSDFLMLQVSSFRFPKDQKTVIKSLQYLPEHVKLLLAGEGVLREECVGLVKQLNLKDRVLFLGNRNDIPGILKTCDAVVLSSNYEGLSLASIEGMASGRPFLASDVPGLAEIVGGAGILFPQSDDRKLADEILKLMTDQEHYTDTAQKGSARAAQYDIQKMVDQHIALYRSLLK